MIRHLSPSPLSLNELNARLKICQGPHVLAALTGMESTTAEKLPLEKFLDRISVSLHSCSDLTSENIDTFVTNVRRIYSIQTDADLRLLILFREKIEEQRQSAQIVNSQPSTLPPAIVMHANTSNAVSTSIKGLSTNPKQESAVANETQDEIIVAARSMNRCLAPITRTPWKWAIEADLSLDDDLTRVEEYLKIFSEIFPRSAEARMKTALKAAGASSMETKAELLQIILSHLIQEQQIFEEIQDFLTLMQDYLKHMLAERIVGMEAQANADEQHVASATAPGLLEIPSLEEDPEVLAFYLKIGRYLDIKQIEGKFYLSILPSLIPKTRNGKFIVSSAYENWIVKAKNIDRIYTKFTENMTDEKKLVAVKSVYCLIKVVTTEGILLKQSVESTNSIRSCENLLMNRGNVSSDIFAVVTPLGFISLGIFWRQINQVMSSDSGQLQPCREALTQLEILQCLYEGHQGEQEELYQVAYQMLQRIVRNSKRKRELLKYTKNLAVPPTAILSPFPESLRKEKKVETQTGVFKPKVPAAATKKKSDIEVKPSKHHKGVTTVEPVSDRVPEKSYPATSSSTSDDNTSPPETAVLEASLIVDSSERFLPKPEKIPVVDLSSAKQLPGKSFPYAFDRRVERWHQHPFGQPLPPADFPEYCDTDHAYQELMHVYHALHPFVDRFLSMGIQGTWINSQRQKEDIRIVIVAEVTYKGKKKRGFIVYTIDRTTQVCYHKFFSEKINQDLMCQVINRTFDENDFPELQKAVLADRRKALTPVRALKGTVKIDPIFDFVEIEDKTQELHIRLFKAHDD